MMTFLCVAEILSDLIEFSVVFGLLSFTSDSLDIFAFSLNLLWVIEDLCSFHLPLSQKGSLVF